ncbi:MAG: ABC transporter ATP-binding protein [Candidatus Bipolaricaulota bacterium]
MLVVDQLEFSYEEEPVLKRVSFELDCGEMIGVIGPNGSGKTTLIKCLNGLVEPDSGSREFEGRDLADFSRREIARTIGYVPQVENQTFPSTVFDVVLTGRSARNRWKPSEEDLNAVARTLAELGLDDLALRDVRALSGGQLREVLIARAFAQEPRLLTLDEPMASLDLCHQLEVLNTVRNWLTGERGAVVTFHDLNLAGKYCDRLLIMKEGEIFARGGPDVLTPGTIEPVYGVEVEVNQNNSTRWVEPKRPLTENRG